MRYLAFACLAMSLLVPPAQAQPLYTCGQATVLSVQQVSEATTTRTFAPLPGEDGGVVRLDAASERKRDGYFLVTVDLNGTVYTGRAKADAPENFDPTTLATSEMIAACINDTQMVLDRLDGTDFRARVVRVEHRLSRTF